MSSPGRAAPLARAAKAGFLALAWAAARLPAAAPALPAVISLGAPPATAEEISPTGGNAGGIGLIETRNARFREDGTLELGGSLRHQRRFWFVNLQALPFLETTFRLSERLDGTSGRGMTTDRAFDLKLRLWRESDTLPALAIGLQDFIGTGLYAGEYIVASKRWHGLDVSAGLGWGRLGSGGEWGSPLALLDERFADRPRSVGRGGTPQRNAFRGGEVAPFLGLEWSLPGFESGLGRVDGLRAKLEWSGDRLRDERGGYPARTSGLRGEAASRVNLGLQWSNEWLDAGLHWVHGTDLLLRLSLRLDPAAPPALGLPAPPPLGGRPLAAEPTAPAQARAIFAALEAAGFQPVAYHRAGPVAEIALAGGTARALPRLATDVLRATQPVLPAGVEMLRLRWWRAGAEIAVLEVPRAALEAAARREASAEEAWLGTRLLPATGQPDAGAILAGDKPGGDKLGGDKLAGDQPATGPRWGWELAPRLALSLGDPSRTLRWQAGLAAGARLELGAGWAVAGALRQDVVGNLAGGLPSDSLLPHVRTDYAAYAREGGTALASLYGERIWNPAPDVFARATAGYLEPMFAGLSTELLWRPHDRPYALGLDLNAVAQRDHDQRLGLRGYRSLTGHASLYAELPVWNLYGVVRAGRYLAGDWGATLELGRRFDSGIEIGGFATVTNVPAARFGEGSFDKGLYVRIPLELFGRPSGARGTVLVRPVQRDGGQLLAVDNPLWEVTRDGRQDALRRGVAGFAP